MSLFSKVLTALLAVSIAVISVSGAVSGHIMRSRGMADADVSVIIFLGGFLLGGLSVPVCVGLASLIEDAARERRINRG